MAKLGIDLGGTFVRAAVVDDAGRILSVEKRALSERSPEAVVEAIAQAATEVLKASGAKVQGCGVGAAGQLQKESGVVSVAPNLGWRNVPFGSLLSKRLGQPVRVVNDLAAATWGELLAGAGRGVTDLLVFFVGSGVGSAYVLDGKLHRGAGGVAGEVGHSKVIPGGRTCGCGEQGCLEAYCGGRNLIDRIRELLATGTSPGLQELTGGDPAMATPLLLEQAAEQGDKAAQVLYEQVCTLLGLAAANQVTILNPGRLLLGGGVLNRCPGMRKKVEQNVWAWASAVSREGLTIADASLGDDSGLIGAALLV